MVRGKMKMAVGDWRSINTFSPSHVSTFLAENPRECLLHSLSFLLGLPEGEGCSTVMMIVMMSTLWGKQPVGRWGAMLVCHVCQSPYCRDCQPAGHRGKQ